MSDLRGILTDIYTARGDLTPKIVVDEARDTDHPLHHRFEWDNSIAGEKYREIQAAQIIRSVKITYNAAGSTEPRTVRGFLPLQREDSPAASYRPVHEVFANELTREMVLRQFRMEWQQLKARYSHLEEFAAIIRDSLMDGAA